MSRNQQTPEGKDPALWELAQKRAGFKKHAVSYVIINAFFWVIWLLSSNRSERDFDFGTWDHLPWPVWSMFGWGIGLVFHFAGAYIFPRVNSVEKEYEKLKNQQQPKN